MPVADQLQRLIDRAVAKRAVRGVLAAIRSGNGEVDAAAVAGSADAALTVPLTIATPYHLASITKMYTAVVVMQLVRERTLDRGFFGGELLSDSELAYMTGRWNRIFIPLQYGGGLMRFNLSRWIAPIKNPGELIGHSGSTGSFAFYSPRRDVFVAGTVNQSDRPNRPFGLMSSILGLVRN